MDSIIRVPQKDRHWLKSATPSEIVEARATGALDNVLRGELVVDEAAQAAAEADPAYLASVLKDGVDIERHFQTPAPAVAPNPGQGLSGNNDPSQQTLTQRDSELAMLRTMSDAEISRRYTAGELNHLLGITKSN